MTVKTLNILELSRFPRVSPEDEISFKSGVNVLVGQKDSGKTIWLEMLDYLLGNSGTPSDAFGADIESRYERVAGVIKIGEERLHLSRCWAPNASRTKVLINDDLVALGDLSELLLEKLDIPRLHFPKGDPYGERAWPSLSFRVLLRHIYRQEIYWTDLADKQSESEQHAALAVFLGVAEALFPEKFGELVEKQKRLAELQVKRETHQTLLDQISMDLVRQNTMAVTVTGMALDETEANLKNELEELICNRQQILDDVQKNTEHRFDKRMQDQKAHLSDIRSQQAQLDAEITQLQARLCDVTSYASMLNNELDRFERARLTSQYVTNLRVTHCPVCDQPAETATELGVCYLCRRSYCGEDEQAAMRRVELEEVQLQEEKNELTEMIGSLERQMVQLKQRREEISATANSLEADLRLARQMAVTLIPPDLSLLDQAQGRINAQIENVHTIRKQLGTHYAIAKEIDELKDAEEHLKSELSALKEGLDLESLSAMFEDRLNDYVNQICQEDKTRWSAGRIIFRLTRQKLHFRTMQGGLGATSRAIMLFAYHYALLSLVKDGCYRYPGFVIMDFPLQLADGSSIRDKENYLLEPFVRLCQQPIMEETQVIAAGHAFEGLMGANRVPITRPVPLSTSA